MRPLSRREQRRSSVRFGKRETFVIHTYNPHLTDRKIRTTLFKIFVTRE